jgi:WD40 repeat protein/Ca2+-binding EF-hand superfamily protein
MENIGQEVEINEKNNEEVHVSNALNLVWSFGINKNVPTINVSTSEKKAIFYVTAHTGILYDFENNVQTLYQGHCNTISCTCVSEDKRWLATGDVGQDCMVIVWDTEKSIPIRTLFEVHPEGTVAMAMSHDAKYIATLSFNVPQQVAIWDWTRDREDPIASVVLPAEYGLQTYVKFHGSDSSQLVSNNQSRVVFYDWNEGELNYCAPELSDKDFNKPVGLYSQSIYHPSSTQALTATSQGNIAVWKPPTEKGSRKCDKKVFKLVKIQEKALTVLTCFNNVLVTGDVTGEVKFFDLSIKLSNWCTELGGPKKFGCTGAINSVSFTYSTSQEDVTKRALYPDSSTLEAAPFVISDFTISTTGAGYLYYKTEGSLVEYIKQEHNQDVKAIACHPKQPTLAIGGFDGLLQIMDFELKMLTHVRQFLESEPKLITCLAYNPTGDYLAIGFECGSVIVVDAVTLQNETKIDSNKAEENNVGALFRHSHESVTKLAFSHDSKFLACSDLDSCVSVFRAVEIDGSIKWEFLGKHRAHYKNIQDMMFMKALDEDKPRLMSIGKDRVLVEYDLVNSGIDDLQLISSTRIEQDATPICLTHYPPVTKEDFIVIANDKFKMKLMNSTTKMCRHTFLGPTYGSPIQKMCALPFFPDFKNRYMAYTTVDKVGLLILPLDGNPHKSMSLIAHPSQVYNIASSYDGKHVFTAGGPDTSVLMWQVNIQALEAIAALGGDGLLPFYGLLEGGKDGELFSELEDYFYYSQMRSQGVDSMEKREVLITIPLSEIPFVMRALGYYPSEQEVEDMTNEVKFSQYVDTGLTIDKIDLAGLIKLYINHRPAFGLQPEDLEEAFDKLGIPDENGENVIERAELLELLQERGEHLSEEELAEYIALLLGVTETSLDTDEIDKHVQIKNLEDHLPELISTKMFTDSVLGLGDVLE